MKNKEIVKLFNDLKEIQKKPYYGTKFAYVISKNISILKNEIEIISNSLPKLNEEELGKYNKERVGLAIEYSEKNDDGEAVIENNRYKIKNGVKDEFEKKNEELKEKYSEIIAESDKIQKEEEKLLEQESDSIDLRKIKLDELPDNLTPIDFALIAEIVEE